jgi:hypothetical protein
MDFSVNLQFLYNNSERLAHVLTLQFACYGKNRQADGLTGWLLPEMSESCSADCSDDNRIES